MAKAATALTGGTILMVLMALAIGYLAYGYFNKSTQIAPIPIANIDMGGSKDVTVSFLRSGYSCCEEVAGTISGPPNYDFAVYVKWEMSNWKLLYYGKLDSTGKYSASRPICTAGNYKFVAVILDKEGKELKWSDPANINVAACQNQQTTTTTTLQGATTTTLQAGCGSWNYPQCSTGTCPGSTQSCQLVQTLGIGETCQCMMTIPTTTLAGPQCTDTDGGYMLTVGGYVDYNYAMYPDTCTGPQQIKEWICDATGAKSFTVDCPSGKWCLVGGTPPTASCQTPV